MIRPNVPQSRPNSHIHLLQSTGLAKDCSNSIANALELLQSCTKTCFSVVCDICLHSISISDQATFPRAGPATTYIYFSPLGESPTAWCTGLVFWDTHSHIEVVYIWQSWFKIISYISFSYFREYDISSYITYTFFYILVKLQFHNFNSYVSCIQGIDLSYMGAILT